MRRKNEEIRRLLSAARSMCDLSELDLARRKISEAIISLDEADKNKTKKNQVNRQDVAKKYQNPLSAIRAIEAEIGTEIKKFTKNDDALMND